MVVKREQLNWGRLFKMFSPLFVLSAITPFLLGYSFNFSSAARSNELRIWTEPQSISIKKNQTVQFKVMGAYDDDKKLITDVTAALSGSAGLQLSQRDVHYNEPFQGTVTLGTVTVSAQNSGTYELAIDANRTTALPDSININTAAAKITVRE